jgi:hypothetical protein
MRNPTYLNFEEIYYILFLHTSPLCVHADMHCVYLLFSFEKDKSFANYIKMKRVDIYMVKKLIKSTTRKHSPNNYILPRIRFTNS